MKKAFLLLLIFIFAAVGLGAYEAVRFLNYQSPEPATVYFEKGSSLKTISKNLKEGGVISNAFYFEILARASGKASKLKAGEYEFESRVTPWGALTKIARGATKRYQVTIPEGYRFTQILQLLKEKGFPLPEDAASYISNAELISKHKISISSLEGYLFPDTYSFDRTTTLHSLLDEMLTLFWKKITPASATKAEERGLNLHQWVTLASIVEKETGAAAERPIIASVFFNRMKIGMPLQTDPTVIYGIKDFNGNLTRADLERDHPYNTYTRGGLPPGPIASPGLAALTAVIEAPETELFYFVGKGDGTHQFSKTLDEHNAAVNLYQRGGQ